eukprot:11839085-Karenia_brevis.AAC.1
MEKKESSRLPTELLGLGSPAAGSTDDYSAGMGGLAGDLGVGAGRGLSGANGTLAIERVIATRRESPDVIIAANERAIKQVLGVLAGESWSVTRHTRQELMPQCGNFTTLKRILAVLSAALDEGRSRGALHQHAFLWHAYRVFEAAALSEGHE